MPEGSPPGTRCISCDMGHYGCSIFVKRKKEKPTASRDDHLDAVAGPSARGQANESASAADPSSPPRSTRPSAILKNLVKPFTRRSSDVLPAEPPIPPHRPLQSRPQVMEVSIPRSRPVSTLSSSPFTSTSTQALSPYSMAEPVPSSTSLASYVSSAPSDSPSLRFELERLRIRWRESQQNLRIALEASTEQRELYERELAARETRHQQELEEARRGFMSSKAAGKRRKE